MIYSFRTYASRFGLLPLLSALLFSGCTSPGTGSVYLPPISNQSSNAPTQPLTPNTAATIIGSRVQQGIAFPPDPVVFLVSIDDKSVGSGWRGWNAPVLVAPGDHVIEFSECYCSLISNAPVGLAYVNITLRAGHSYTLNASAPQPVGIAGSHGDSAFANALFGSAVADAWITNEDGEIVSEIYNSNGNLVTQKYHFVLGPRVDHGFMIPE